MEHEGVTLWFTGMSGAGKTTLARKLEAVLLDREMKVEVLDGDIIRTNLSKGLGFSKEDRDINIRRIGFVCNLLTRNGVATIVAAISPYAAVREENRQMIGRYAEIYCKCPLQVLEQRDVKGLYKKARAGEIKGFTGIDDPYEEPEKPEIVIESDKETVEQSLAKILKTLEILGYIPRCEEAAEFPPEQEAAIKERLATLRYI